MEEFTSRGLVQKHGLDQDGSRRKKKKEGIAPLRFNSR